VVVLENCVDLVEGETGSCSEACVTCDGDGTEAVCIKVEDAVDIKDEIPEAKSFPSIKTEHEVRLWGVCDVVVAACAFGVCAMWWWWQCMLLGHLLM
jgi:hypothetical protein